MIAAMLLLMVLYILPTIVAQILECPDHRRICAVNVLLGWLVIPWWYAIIWAYRTRAR